MNPEMLLSATHFLWTEADMLDHAEYDAWLDLWDPAGLYIVPIDPATEDFADTLNYAHDDADMRAKRVARLTGGESVSTQPAARTVRSVSRIRILGERDGVVTLRAAQDLRDFRKNGYHQHTADVTWELARDGASWRIRRKIVRLINSVDTLSTLGYVL
jgi:3-phenylpropionate/cinnamic acid dioxygenase small subunit